MFNIFFCFVLSFEKSDDTDIITSHTSYRGFVLFFFSRQSFTSWNLLRKSFHFLSCFYLKKIFIQKRKKILAKSNKISNVYLWYIYLLSNNGNKAIVSQSERERNLLGISIQHFSNEMIYKVNKNDIKLTWKTFDNDDDKMIYTHTHTPRELENKVKKRIKIQKETKKNYNDTVTRIFLYEWIPSFKLFRFFSFCYCCIIQTKGNEKK